MSAANRLSAAALALAIAACGATQDQEQAADNGAIADVDVLPADESVATSSPELANGASDPAVDELGNQH